MKLLFVLLFIAGNAWALTQEELNANIALMNQQTQEIGKRLQRYGSDCGRMLAPLPGRNGTPIHFHTAVAAIENMASNIQSLMSQACMNLLLQNLASLPSSASTNTVMQRLADMTRPSVAAAPQIQTACTPPGTDFAELTNLMTTVRNLDQCAPVPAGKGKRVKGRSAYGRDLDYLLFKEKDNEFRAVLNVDFQMNNSSVTSAQMLNRAKGCLAGANESFKGPNGKKLKIDLLSPNEIGSLGLNAARKPAAQVVKITPGNIGSNSSNYQENIPCPTLVHEVLHLLGLCDEYSGGRDNFSCRARGPLDSVMESAETAFARAVPRRVTCQCDDSELCETLQRSPAAREFLRYPRFEQITNIRFRNNYCEKAKLSRSSRKSWLEQNNNNYPAVPIRLSPTNDGGVIFEELSLDEEGELEGFRYECSCASGDVEECRKAAKRIVQGPRETVGHDCPAYTSKAAINWGTTPRASAATEDTISFDVPAVPGASLLQPAHFERIVSGTCPTTTPRYSNCAAFAYETDPNKCADAPDYCQSASWLQEGTP